MLKKCLKYDLAAVFRILWILLIIMLGAVLAAGVSMRVCIESAQFLGTEPHDPSPIIMFPVILGVFGGYFSAIGCFIAAVGCATVCSILTYWRVYSNFFTDEGYLTFTLPVKRSTLYLSKVITAAIVELSTGLLFVLGIALILLVAPPTEDGALLNPIVYTGLADLLGEAWKLVGGWMILWIVAALPIPLLACLFTSGMTMLCITVGAVIAKKHKLLAAIGIYYGVTTVLSFVGQLIMTFLSGGMVGIFGFAFDAGMTPAGLTVTAVLVAVSAITACIGVTLHFITVHLVEHRLNLA